MCAGLAGHLFQRLFCQYGRQLNIVLQDELFIARYAFSIN